MWEVRGVCLRRGECVGREESVCEERRVQGWMEIRRKDMGRTGSGR